MGIRILRRQGFRSVQAAVHFFRGKFFYTIIVTANCTFVSESIRAKVSYEKHSPIMLVFH